MGGRVVLYLSIAPCYYYDCMIKDTFTAIKYHVQYLILDAQRNLK